MLKKTKVFIVIMLQIITAALFSVENQTIYKIVFRGNLRVRPAEITSVIKTMEGMPLNLALLEEDYYALLGLDKFEDVKFFTEEAINERTNQSIPGMVNLIFEFVEKPTVRRVIFNGNKSVSYGFLSTDINIERNKFFSRSELLTDINAIIDRYKKQGFNQVQVTWELFSDEEYLQQNNQVDIIININEGMETYVSNIVFEGNNIFSEFTLENIIKTKERKFLGLQKGTFDNAEFTADIEELRKYYRDRGYINVEIYEPQINRQIITENDITVETIEIKIVINEGNRYRFGELIIEGNRLFSYDDLTYNMKTRAGYIFNYSRFREDIYGINQKYTNSGYIQTQITENQIIDEENFIISYKLNITESERSYIESVSFSGNTKSKDYVLRRAVYTEEGDIFTSDALMASIIGLYNLGFFSEVEYDIQGGSAPGLLKITYLVKEQSTAELRFGLQVTTNKWPPEVTFFGEITERNLLGREMTISGKVEASPYKQGFEFSWEDAWFWNYPWLLGGSVKFYHNWNNQVLRVLSDDDYNAFYKANPNRLGASEQEIRDYFNDKYANNDQNNPNYLGKTGDIFQRGLNDISFELSPRMGYRFAKYFSVSGSYLLSPIFTFLNPANGSRDDIFSDYYKNLLNEEPDANGWWGGWSVKSALSATFSISTTQRRVNPEQGIRFSVTAGYTGLFGTYDSFQLSTQFTAYLKLLELYFNDYPFKHVLVFNSKASFIFPGFRNLVDDPFVEGGTRGKGPILSNEEYLKVDGFFVGRGWTNSIGATSYEGRLVNNVGYARFDFSLEYRVPINEKYVWLAAFIDMVNLVEGPKFSIPRLDSNGNVTGTTLDSSQAWKWWEQTDALQAHNWYGSIGVGFQVTWPQLPLSFYIVKRFKINQYSGFEWVGNQPNTGNLDFVLSIVGYYF